ncbi:MAG: NAD-dependent epimerase/dehydratase family protein [Bacteroidota bacterium]
MKKVLITGGTGFIGSHTVELFLSKGVAVRCLVRRHHKSLGWIEKKHIEIQRGDLSEPALLDELLHGVDTVIHVAGITKAKTPAEYYAGNVQSTQNLLDAAVRNGGIQKFCYVSSQTVIGPSPTGIPLTESDPCHPITNYAKSKLEAEHRCHQAMDKIPIVILRPSAVFGPRDKDVLEIYKFVELGIRPVLGSSQKTLSIVYGPDLAEAIYQATLSDRTAGETYFVTDPSVFQFSEIIRCMASITGKKSFSVFLPSPLFYSIAGIVQFVSLLLNKPALLNIEKARDLLQKHWVCSPQKIFDQIQFKTQTPIFDALRSTYAWYKEIGWL